MSEINLLFLQYSKCALNQNSGVLEIHYRTSWKLFSIKINFYQFLKKATKNKCNRYQTTFIYITKMMY